MRMRKKPVDPGNQPERMNRVKMELEAEILG